MSTYTPSFRMPDGSIRSYLCEHNIKYVIVTPSVVNGWNVVKYGAKTTRKSAEQWMNYYKNFVGMEVYLCNRIPKKEA